MMQIEIIQILAGFVGSIGFAVLFNIRGKKLLVTAAGGLLSWLLFVILSKGITNEPVIYFIIAGVVSICAEVMARVLKTPTATFITTSLIPLIPGSSLYYTMAYALEQNADMFLRKAMYTLQMASALALGIIASTTLTRIIFQVIKRKNRKNV